MVAYQSLYRRYRSQKFSEVRGQSHVTSALRTAVAENRYGHAYLFSGPRGTGKTSTARILAKALNCPDVAGGEPCGVCDSCLAIEQGRSFDLHELDAASHNKVDDVRDLISRVNLGSPGRTKVYILDEVHMLSSGAENALLKTLEEPPDHVVFVLATTEPHKVVSTIRSRTQHFEFHLLPADELAEHVRWVIDDAGLDVDESAIDYVLAQGGGSARDTLSALDLVAAAGGVPAGSDVGVDLVRAIGACDAAAAIATVQQGLTTGQEPRTIGEITIDVLRNTFLAAMGAPLHHLNDRAQETATELASELGPATVTRSLEAVGQALVEMRQAPDPRVPLEVALLRLCRGPESAAGPAAPSPATPAAPPPSAPSGEKATTDPELSQRVAELERQIAELTARLAADRPPARTPKTAAPQRSEDPEPKPASAEQGQATPPGPAAAARNRLAESGAKPPPSPRRRRAGGRADSDVATDSRTGRDAADVGSGGRTSGDDEPATNGTVPDPDPSAEGTSEPPPPPADPTHDETAGDPTPETTGTPQRDTTTDPQPEATADTQAETTGGSQPKAAGDTQPETAGDPQPETTGGSQPQTTGGSQPDTTGGSQPDTTADPQPETTGRPQPETTGGSQPETTGDTQPETTADTQPETTGRPQPETTTDLQPETTADPQPGAAADTQPETNGDAGPDVAATPAPADRPGLTSALTLAAVEGAFAACLDQVSQKTRVRFKGGRVLGVEGSTVSFGVPTDIHRNRCRDVADEVAEALGTHFGHDVGIDVVLDGEAAPPPDPAKIEPAPVVTPDADEDIGPIEELADAADQSMTGVERLTRAFPGSKLIESEPEDEKR